MALLITKDLNVKGGLFLSQLYVRLYLTYNFGGKSVGVNTQNYIDASAYAENDILNMLRLEEIPEHSDFSYDRNVDGVDLLLFAHDKIKVFLSTDVYEDVPQIDPSTAGEYLYDPSTGELLTESVLSKPKFAEISEIAIIDVSI